MLLFQMRQQLADEQVYILHYFETNIIYTVVSLHIFSHWYWYFLKFIYK